HSKTDKNDDEQVLDIAVPVFGVSTVRSASICADACCPPRYALPQLLKRGGGAVVYTSSYAAFMSNRSDLPMASPTRVSTPSYVTSHRAGARKASAQTPSPPALS